MPSNPVVKGFWERQTGSWQYVFHDPETMEGAIVDPVWNFDPHAGALSTKDAETILAYIAGAGINISWILDTHPHADHFSAAPYLKGRLGAPTGIGENVVRVQALWKDIYNLGEGLPADGRQWDRLFKDGDVVKVGNMPVSVLFSPGHTMASVVFVAGDAVFANDTLMMPHSGSSRTDFPGGDPRQLFHSIRRILAMSDATRIFIGHDYPAPGSEPACEASVADHKATNRHFGRNPSEEEFVKARAERDATLPLPTQMLAALQVNIRGGRLPEPEDNGRSYLKIPVGYFQSKISE